LHQRQQLRAHRGMVVIQPRQLLIVQQGQVDELWSTTIIQERPHSMARAVVIVRWL
jgi:hypothetical protein